MSGYIAVDLDGTLAFYDRWINELHIGAPIAPMVERVKEWLARGVEVRIFTARVTEGLMNADGTPHDVEAVRIAIQDWCEKYLGKRLKVQNFKDYQMIEYYDDRAIQIIRNTGRRADGRP